MKIKTGKFIKVIFFDLGETLVTADRQWMTGAQATLAALREKGLRLGIISNTGNLKRAQLVEKLPPDFDFGDFEENLVILSSEVKVEKPDLKIFRLALKKAGADATECLFCTEEPTHIAAAKKAGFKTIQISSPADIADLTGNLVKIGWLT
ncbi:MAG: HAD-IA family hydrolase [Acidobacteriota bacterium]|nr:HAD-IA family hydrolase [Acidobacteriota bacterium]